jgi:hypothetical protein
VVEKIPVPDDLWPWDDSYTCPKCGKVYKTTNEWLNSDCWYEDHDPLEE